MTAHENTPRPGCPWCHEPGCSPTCPGPGPAIPPTIPFDNHHTHKEAHR